MLPTTGCVDFVKCIGTIIKPRSSEHGADRRNWLETESGRFGSIKIELNCDLVLTSRHATLVVIHRSRENPSPTHTGHGSELLYNIPIAALRQPSEIGVCHYDVGNGLGRHEARLRLTNLPRKNQSASFPVDVIHALAR